MQQPDSTSHPALYLRAAGPDGLHGAVSAGADGVSYAVELRADGIAAVGGVPLADALAAATDLGLRVEIVAGQPLRPASATPVIAAAAAALVSARQISPAVPLSSLDHAGVMAIVRGVPQLSVGLRHLSTLHHGADYARRAGADVLSPMVGAASRGDVHTARQHGLVTHGWTVDLDAWPIDEVAQVDAAGAAGFDAVTVSDAALVARMRGER